jgi:predicted DCC family thiol-disulfide oxidoreductase YuxK
MSGPATQPPSNSEGAHLVLYDGVCGLCNRVVQFLLRHDRRKVFHFAPLQGVVGRARVARAGANPDELTSFYVLADYRTERIRLFRKSAAALFVARELGWPWKAALAMRALPPPVRDALYDRIARTRYRIFGRFDQCPVPRPEFRGRFLE